MPDWGTLETRLTHILALPRRPVAIAFTDVIPDGVRQFTGSEPSGCSFWRLAAQGGVFYTVPGDHYNCAIGSYTHHMELPPERAHELDDTLALMTGAGYLRMEEVAGIPRLPRTPAAVVFSPLGEATVAPDVVLVAGRPGKLMWLHEAAGHAGVATSVPWLGRPTCMALPAVIDGGAVASVGCVGNRVYTGIGDDELYVALAGRDVERVVQALDVIAAANVQLRGFHEVRRRELATE